MRNIKARKGRYSMQGCSHWEETIVSNKKIFFKEKTSANQKPKEQMKKELYSGKSTIPPQSDHS